jgi:hypothetical protein
MQVVPRVWPAGAVHDTVQVVVQSRAFRRSLQSSIVERVWGWVAEWLDQFVHYLRGTSGARYSALALAAALVLLVVARFVLAARARGPDSGDEGWTRGAVPGEDPWRAAERLAAAGRYEDAAHALYRGVVASVAREDRLRLDPSKTSGDYARELRARGSSRYAPFRVFGRRFDVAVYGHGRCDAALVDDLRRLAEPFRPGARAA